MFRGKFRIFEIIGPPDILRVAPKGQADKNPAQKAHPRGTGAVPFFPKHAHVILRGLDVQTEFPQLIKGGIQWTPAISRERRNAIPNDFEVQFDQADHRYGSD